ncbi:MAG TPA: radical SAM protein [Pirellulales bacterium]|nr:radical SAM protein [Pirellulales bacterium]
MADDLQTAGGAGVSTLYPLTVLATALADGDKKRRQPLPRYVQLEPVGQCNLRCQMCPIPFRQDGPPHGPPAFMKFETFTKIVDELPELEHLHLQGLGEPMMHPRFFEMAIYAAERGVRVTTNTNLTLLLNPRRAALAVACGLDCIHISVDGATAETYERIRVRARFDRLLRNFQLLDDARRNVSHPPQLRLVSVVMRQNLDELAELVRFAHRWSIDEMFVQHLCHDFGESTLPAAYQPMRRFVDSQTLLGESPARIERAFAAARRVADELGVDLRLPSVQPHLHLPGTPGPERCDWPYRGAYISYQGFSMPCCMISTPDRMNFGDVTQQDLAAVWHSPAYESFRRQLASDTPPEICRSCAIYSGTF